jgi:4-hydroxythreonine-4-phosphate dehydrogenase
MVVVADRELLRERARLLRLPLEIADYPPIVGAVSGPGVLHVLHISLAEHALPGKLDAANAQYVLSTLRRAVEGCVNGEFNALVTGPVHKGIINDGGIAFTGHTEYLRNKPTAAP